VRRVDTAGATMWTYRVGDSHKNSGTQAYSTGYSVVQSGSVLYVGAGLWDKASSLQKPTIIALNLADGSVIWKTTVSSRGGMGAVRSVIVKDGRVIGTGYTNGQEPGFLFVNDEGKMVVWELDTAGNLVKEQVVQVEAGQGAKIRSDPAGGFVAATTGWGEMGGSEVNVVVLVKLSSSLALEWTKNYGMAGGNSQMFDLLVDNDGHYLLGGHTTVGTAENSGTGVAVVNWDYLAIKVNSQTKQVEWRKTFGQPRGFDARWIHDEMYCVGLDAAGNYLLLGGSGDEYSYSATNSNGQSDIWVSYLVVVSPAGEMLYQGTFGDPAGNNAGEWLSVDSSGDVMIYTDSDTQNGFGFLKLSKN